MQVKILYAGTNSFDGSDPHIWYVIAEVRASARSDGSELGHNGCDAPGSFFLQLKDGSWCMCRKVLSLVLWAFG